MCAEDVQIFWGKIILLNKLWCFHQTAEFISDALFGKRMLYWSCDLWLAERSARLAVTSSGWNFDSNAINSSGKDVKSNSGQKAKYGKTWREKKERQWSSLLFVSPLGQLRCWDDLAGTNRKWGAGWRSSVQTLELSDRSRGTWTLTLWALTNRQRCIFAVSQTLKLKCSSICISDNRSTK